MILEVSHGTAKGTGRTVTGEGEGVFVTQSPKFSWLNNKRFRREIMGSNLTDEEHVKLFAL
ncbi:MAG TPA: hypothetical protein VFF30_13705 [Nitrososphaerales archaeon]|nr:hypothetical protein [Nitrososphaerales archaeon]